MTRLFAALLLLVVTVGCANVEVRPINKDDVKGVRFYRPWPYLWIKPTAETGKSGCTVDIVYLPDMSQEYIIIPHAWIGSVTMETILTQGWALTAFNATADSKASEMVTAISGLVGNIAALAGKPASLTDETGKAITDKDGKPKPLPAGLYALRFGKDGMVKSLDAAIQYDDTCSKVKPS